MKTVFKISILCLLMLLSSCVKDIDFDQASSLEITPALAVSLARFEFDQGSLIDNVTNDEISVKIDRITFSAFDNIQQERKEYLERVTVLFEIVNEFDRSFELDFSFFDAGGNLTYQFQTIQVGAESTYDTPEDIIIANHPNILNSREASITIRLLPSTDGSTIDPNDPKELTFKTSGNFYFRISQI